MPADNAEDVERTETKKNSEEDEDEEDASPPVSLPVTCTPATDRLGPRAFVVPNYDVL